MLGNEAEGKIIRAGIYVRVSTEEQANEGYSIPAQIEKLRDYARIKDWQVYDVYADQGISGKNITERPEINRMIKDIISGAINTVVVYKIDRLTRNLRDLIDLVDLFNEHKCDFNSLMESIDTTTASGRMFLKIIGIFAEFERENICERTRLGFEKKARSGYTNSPKPALGYDRKKGELIQTINEEEAEIIRKIFDLYINSNKSLTAVAKYMNLANIKTKKGNHFIQSNIKKILTNPTYMGKVRHCRDDKERTFVVDGKHKAIIEEDTFIKVQDKISKIKSKTKTKWPKEENFFLGTLYCGVCGERLATHVKYSTNKKGEKKLQCSYRCQNKTVGACNAKQMSHKKVEKAFLEYIDGIEDLNVEDKIDIEQYNAHEETDDEQLYNECTKKLATLEKKQSTIMDHFINDELVFEEFSKMKNMVRKEIDEMKDVINKIDLEKTEQQKLTKEDIVNNIKENWQALTNSEKMQFVNQFIDKIIIINKPLPKVIEGKIEIKEMIFY